MLIRQPGVRADSKASNTQTVTNNTGYPVLRQEWERVPWSSKGGRGGGIDPRWN